MKNFFSLQLDWRIEVARTSPYRNGPEMPYPK